MRLITLDEKIALVACRLGQYVAVLDREDIKAIIEEEDLLPPTDTFFTDVPPLLPGGADSHLWN